MTCMTIARAPIPATHTEMLQRDDADDASLPEEKSSRRVACSLRSQGAAVPATNNHTETRVSEEAGVGAAKRDSRKGDSAPKPSAANTEPGSGKSYRSSP